MQGLAGSESSSETGLNRPITEDDSLQISGRAGLSFTGHGFDSIAEAPENIPKVNHPISLQLKLICHEIKNPAIFYFDAPRLAVAVVIVAEKRSLNIEPLAVSVLCSHLSPLNLVAVIRGIIINSHWSLHQSDNL